MPPRICTLVMLFGKCVHGNVFSESKENGDPEKLVPLRCSQTGTKHRCLGVANNVFFLIRNSYKQNPLYTVDAPHYLRHSLADHILVRFQLRS